MTSSPDKRFERYVAVGDSSTEGLMDVDEGGHFRGWSRRLAARIAELQDELLYANLGVSGLTTRQIRDTQLSHAISMEPDLVTIFSGTNDVISARFDGDAVERDMELLQRTFVESGATVVTFTLPNLTAIMPIARLIAPRIHRMNEAVRSTAARTGTRVVDFASYPVATDNRLWHEDRIHANSHGHARIAAALMGALELPGTDDAWSKNLPSVASPSFATRLTAEIAWTFRYLIPWMGQGLAAAITKNKETPQHPRLEPFPTDVKARQKQELPHPAQQTSQSSTSTGVTLANTAPSSTRSLKAVGDEVSARTNI